ncbi:MAG TPA: hypothetical protein PKE16_05895, partial [Hyphomicrobium sp.]|nr:hypothetical protein [Hyphomicrobium sp.]
RPAIASNADMSADPREARLRGFNDVRKLGKADLGVDSQVSYKFHTDRLVGSVEPKSRFAEKADIAPCARHTT